MPAKSEKQRRFFGMVLGVKRGKTKVSNLPKRVQKKVRKAARDLTEEQVRDYAKKPRGRK